MKISANNAVKLIAQSSDTESNCAYLLIEIPTTDKTRKQVIIPVNSILDLKEIKRTLVGVGHPLADDPRYWKAVNKELYKMVDERFDLLEKPGWSQHYYIGTDEQVLGKTKSAKPRLNPDSFRRVGSSIPYRGKAHDFREEMSPILLSSSRIMLAVCSVYSGYIASFADIDTGGFHFYGDSSIGKTTCLRLAASIQWGVDGAVSWDMTEKGFEEVALNHNHNTLILDELKLLDGDPVKAAKKATKLVYMLAEGRGKRRSTVFQASVAQWKLSLLSAGERSLTEHAMDGGTDRFAGEMVRLIDVPADAGTGLGIYDYLPENVGSIEEYIRHVADVSDNFKGTGYKFIRGIGRTLLIKGEKGLKAIIERYMDDFMSESALLKLGGQKQRMAKRFALAYAAGRLAIDKGCIEVSADELKKGIMGCAQASLLSDLDEGITPHLNKLCSELIGFSEKQDLYESQSQRMPTLKKAPVILYQLKGTPHYALTTSYFDQCVDQKWKKALLKSLFQQGALSKDSSGKSTRTISKLGQRRYMLDVSKVQEYWESITG